jgi:hypothetical protein
MMKSLDVCVVGGGLSGLNFAAESAEILGKDTRVSLIEARNRSGGRTIRSEQESSPMQELGAFFVYDRDVFEQLQEIGAQIRLLGDEDFFIARKGVIVHCGKEQGPFGIIDGIATQLSQLPRNISIQEGLQQNATFQALQPEMQSIVTTVLESDLAAPLDRVGISSLRYDGQTVVNGTCIEDAVFGICLNEGFSSLAHSLGKRFSGSKRYSVKLEGVEVEDDGVVLHLFDKVRNAEFIETADKVFLGLPLGGVQDLEFFEHGKSVCKLSAKLNDDQRRALSMLNMGDAIKISVPIRGRLIPNTDVFNIALSPDPQSPIRCGEVWGLPMPSYGDHRTDKSNEFSQVVMMYLGGDQALELRRKLLEAKEHRLHLPNLLNQWVRDYLLLHLGISEDRVGKVYISMWLNQNGGRGCYSFIKADNQPTDFNPRAQFKEPPFGRIHIGGSAFSEEEPTLTGGAQASAEAHLKQIGQEMRPGSAGDSKRELEEHTFHSVLAA